MVGAELNYSSDQLLARSLDRPLDRSQIALSRSQSLPMVAPVAKVIRRDGK